MEGSNIFSGKVSSPKVEEVIKKIAIDTLRKEYSKDLSVVQSGDYGTTFFLETYEEQGIDKARLHINCGLSKGILAKEGLIERTKTILETLGELYDALASYHYIREYGYSGMESLSKEDLNEKWANDTGNVEGPTLSDEEILTLLKLI